MRGITLQSWQATARYTDHLGHRIAWWMEGEPGGVRPTLLLIHGFPTASFDWYKIWDDLKARFNVIAVDMIGFGLSDKPTRYKYSIMDQADILQEVLAQAGVERFHILAHDYGDTVAQELLARHAEGGKHLPEIKSCCFLNGGLFPETHHATFTQKLLASPLGWLVSRLMQRDDFDKGLSGVFGVKTQPATHELDAFWDMATTSGDLRKIAHKLIGYIRERKRNRSRWVDVLTDAAVPLMLIDGGADPVSGEHMLLRYKELVQPSHTVLLEGIGHYPQVEAPLDVLKYFLEFNPGKAPSLGGHMECHMTPPMKVSGMPIYNRERDFDLACQAFDAFEAGL